MVLKLIKYQNNDQNKRTSSSKYHAPFTVGRRKASTSKRAKTRSLILIFSVSFLPIGMYDCN